jgi:tetratricopeptide (TPR) repeat protein
MSVRVAKNRFISFSLVAEYHHFLEGISNIVELGKHLTSAAETAQLIRQADTVREYGLILSNLPVKEYQLIGRYYLGWCACWNGIDVAPSFFESIFDQSRTYKAKALITLGGLAAAKGNFEDEMRYRKEALKYSDLATSIRVLRGIAVVKAKEGFHKSAAHDLEKLVPLLRHTQAPASYEILNSLAFELCEVGRIEEAANISRIVLASPYAFAYPEYRETANEVAFRGYKSRSVISFKQQKPENLLRLPDREPSESVRRSPFFQPSSITKLADWKKKMVKEPNGDNDIDEKIDEMDDRDLLATLIQIAAKDDVDEEKLRDVVKFAIKSLGLPKQK